MMDGWMNFFIDFLALECAVFSHVEGIFCNYALSSVSEGYGDKFLPRNSFVLGNCCLGHYFANCVASFLTDGLHCCLK